MKLSEARILVVDDDAVMLKYVLTALDRLGVTQTQSCADGTQALPLVESFRPDLVLSDIHMEPMGGLDFVRRLREHPQTSLRNTRVIFMSADSSMETLQEALPLNTFGYIVKPPRPETLRNKLLASLKT